MSNHFETTNLDLKLIRLVKENPVLYDPSRKSYTDFNAREVAWQKIGDEMKRPASECKARWVNIRDINRRNLRKRYLYPELKGRAYKYYEQLSFMLPHYKDVLVHNSGEGEDEVDNSKADGDDDDNDGNWEQEPGSDEDSVDEKPIITVKTLKSTSKRRKKVSELFDNPVASSSNRDASTPPTDIDTSDKVDAFLLSIGATLKTFSPYYLNLAKSKIFAVVQEYELKQIVSKHGQGTGIDDVDIG